MIQPVPRKNREGCQKDTEPQNVMHSAFVGDLEILALDFSLDLCQAICYIYFGSLTVGAIWSRRGQGDLGSHAEVPSPRKKVVSQHSPTANTH